MKKLLVFVMLCSLTFTMFAEHVGKNQAAEIAGVVLPNRQFNDISDAIIFSNLYIFSDDHSFVIVSADDSYRPIIAYSDNFPFVIENMPDNIRFWLGSMNNEIQYAIDNDIVATEEVESEWYYFRQGVLPTPKTRTSVLPLVHTHWDQGEPYNNLCPSKTNGDGNCPVGCGATAMAQVMKYWEWPRQGTGSHSYTSGVGGTQSANFGNTVYDWDNMVDQPTTSSPANQQEAVAKLSYHCGVSIDMQYGNNGSSAYPSDVIDALKTYFDYSNSISSKSKNNYSTNQWINLLKTEINAGRPILYSGWDNGGGGHGFICDGYDENNNFHFNWGWNGSCDGYYAIGYLSPGQGGIGSGSGCYNENNYILTGVQPNSASINAPSNVAASVNGRTVTLTWNAVSGAAHYKVYRDGFVINSNVSGTSFNDTNVTYGTHEYFVRSVKSNGNYSHASSKASATVTFEGPVPTGLTATVNGNNVNLSWTAPANETAVLKYGDGSSAGSMGYGTPTDFYWGQRFTTSQLADYAGMAIQSVQVYHNESHQYTLYIYSFVNGQWSQVFSKVYNSTSANSWHTVNLTTPWVIDYEHDMIVAVYSADLSYPATYVTYTESSDGAMYSGDGNGFSTLGGVSWLIKTNISDGNYTYSIYRDGNAITSNVIPTTYQDNGVAAGSHNYYVRTNYYGGLSNPSNTVNAVVSSSDPLSVTTTNITQPACNGGNDGSVTASAQGGTPPYIYHFNGQTSPSVTGTYTFNNVSAGTYTLTVTDYNSNSSSTTVVVNEPAAVVVTISGNTQIIVGQSTTLTASGAVSYQWNNGQTTASITVSPITTTTYSVVGTNASGCEGYAQVTVNVSDSDLFLAVDEVVDVTCFGGNDGSVTVSAHDGFPPYIFMLGEQSTGQIAENSYTFTGIEAGYCQLSVTDGIGNSATAQATVMQPDGLSAGTISSDGETIYPEDTPNIITSIQDATSGQPIIIYRWKVNGNVIDDTNVNEYVPENLELGTYTYTREVKDDCTDWTPSAGSWTVNVILDVVGENEKHQLEVFPNPTDGMLNVVCEGMKNISITTMTGACVSIIEVNDNNHVVDMSSYKSGTYMLIINTEKGIVRKMIVKY